MRKHVRLQSLDISLGKKKVESDVEDGVRVRESALCHNGSLFCNLDESIVRSPVLVPFPPLQPRTNHASRDGVSRGACLDPGPSPDSLRTCTTKPG